MSYYRFKTDDLFYNTIETWPEVQFDIYDHKVYLNNKNNIKGAFVGSTSPSGLSVGCVPPGYISLFELNVDRDIAAQTYDPKTNPDGIKTKIFPFVTKGGSFEAVGNVSVQDYFSSFEYGDIITGSYPMSASLTRSGTFSLVRPHISALENTLNFYTPMSPQYAFSSSLRDFANDDINFLNVPSIFYGSQIRRGSVYLKFYISGNFVGELHDKNYNGELVQVNGDNFAQANGADRTAGIVLYNEGIILLTGSWGLMPEAYDFGIGGPHTGSWLDFAAGAHDGAVDVTPSASFLLNFEGKKYVETLTMHARAPKSDLNFSSNPTYLDHTSYTGKPPITGSYVYKEQEDIQIFNTVSSSFYDYEEKFKNQTYIGKIGIYDNARNLIAIAKLATPIKKNTGRDFTFKLKVDL